jgi:hypothetical protein
MFGFGNTRKRSSILVHRPRDNVVWLSVIQERGVPSRRSASGGLCLAPCSITPRAKHIGFRAPDPHRKKKIKKVLNNFVYNKKSIIFVPTKNLKRGQGKI